MSEVLRIHLSDPAYLSLKERATVAGTTAEQFAEAVLERQFGVSPMEAPVRQAARERFERHIGEVNLGFATGADNDSIDLDLANEHSCTNETR